MTDARNSARKSLFHEYGDVSGVDFKDDSLKSASLISHKSQHNVIKFGILLIVIAIVTLSGKTLPMLFIETGEDMLMKVDQSSDWIKKNYEYLAKPFLCGALLTIFSLIIIYYDSDVPGLVPPAPFSPRKSERIRFSVHQEKTSTLNYVVAIVSGIVTVFLLYLM